ncbi:hypothetical protein GGQ85_000173 [Nitrobacter vulgaris]|nr:hypothetical protein [Nitrobacter vulgaris]
MRRICCFRVHDSVPQTGRKGEGVGGSGAEFVHRFVMAAASTVWRLAGRTAKMASFLRRSI